MFRTSLLLLLLTGFTTQAATAQLLGRDVTLPPELRLRPAGEIELQYSDLFDINRCILKQGTVSGLLVHLPPQLEGRIYYGSWELEANPPRPRLRRGPRLQDGATELNLASLTHYPNDIADFGGRQEGDLFLQFEIWDETAAEVVILHRTVHFRVQNGLFQRTVTLVAPPFYSCVVEAGLPLPVISFAADRPVDARVLVAGVEPFVSQQGQRRHEVKLPGLPPQTTYVYRVELNAPDETILSREYTFTTPPLPGAGEPFRAILMSDSRAGVGAGTHAVEGVNHAVLSQLAANAWRLDPDLLLFPGDLINGWCDQPDAFRRQLRSFKSALSFLSPTVPIFTGIGN
ncbi:MAG: fibronectin type III domain-containing protein, partial [Candidatus Delongbacteria bacterium]|nr:fibronectin type III domain-containing protein [Candidatus Delongbacteria bacterium]